MGVEEKIMISVVGVVLATLFILLGVNTYDSFTKQDNLKENGFVYLKGWYPKDIITTKCKE